MTGNLWSQSSASLHEKTEKRTPELQKKQKPQKSDGKEDRSKTENTYTRHLENAFGDMAFWVKNGAVQVQFSRKQEFQEPVHQESREHLNEERLNQQDVGSGRISSDAHDQQISAVRYSEQQTDSSPERIFRNLQQSLRSSNQLTLHEMMPGDRTVQQKIFHTLKLTAEQAHLEQQTSKSDGRRYFDTRQQPETSDEPEENGEAAGEEE